LSGHGHHGYQVMGEQCNDSTATTDLGNFFFILGLALI
jgi:hypothetical protein